jgi:hypothetical protein
VRTAPLAELDQPAADLQNRSCLKDAQPGPFGLQRLPVTVRHGRLAFVSVLYRLKARLPTSALQPR